MARMTKNFHLTVFGNQKLTAPNGEEIPLKTRHQAAILTYLALEAKGRPVRRSTLVELFWPDTTEKKGRHSFSQALFDLRRKLGKNSLESKNGTVKLSATISTELDGPAPKLENLGEPLMGLDDLAGVELSHWLDSARESLNRVLRETRQTDLSEYRASGDMKALRKAADILYQADPLNDAAALAIAEDMLLKGDETGASSTLRGHVLRVSESYGGSPHPEIIDLLKRLATRKPKKVKLVQPVVNMVGRDGELASVEGSWHSIHHGGAVSVLVAGQPGLGKTTLIEKFVDSVKARKWPCYFIQCHEMGRRIPYSAIADLINQLSEEPAVSGTEPGLLAEASRIVPELRLAYPGIPPVPDAEPDSVRLRVASALLGMMDEVCDGARLLVAFDDIHNMDQASKDTLYVLYHRMRARSTMFLCSARSPDVGQVTSRSDIMPWQSTIPLEPLDRAASRELLRAVAEDLDSELAERILELGQDNPHLIEILANDLRKNGEDAIVSRSDGSWNWRAPDTMNRALGGILFGLTTNSQRVLDLIAVVERQIKVTDAVSVLNIGDAEVEVSAMELLERGLVRFDGEALAMKNELHKLYVRSRMNPDIRRFMHARLARQVSASPNGFDTALEQAHHLMRADSLTEAVETVTGGARRAIDKGAPKEAETAILATDKATDVGESQELNFLLGKSLVSQFEYEGATKILKAVMEACTPQFTYFGETKRLLAESMYRGRVGSFGEILGMLHDAISHAEKCNNDLSLAGALQTLAEVAFFIGEDHLIASAANAAQKVVSRSSSEEAKGKASLTLGFCCLLKHDIPKATVAFSVANEHLQNLPLDTSYRRALNGLGMCYTGSGDFEAAKTTFEKSVSVADEIGESMGVAGSAMNLGFLRLEEGEYSQAEKWFRRALEANDSAPTGAVGRFINFAQLAMTTGRKTLVRQYISEAHSAAVRSSQPRDKIDLLLTKADFALSEKDELAAWDFLAEAESISQRHPSALATDTAQIGRLRRHAIYSTAGWQAVEEFDRQSPRGDRVRVLNRLEIGIFLAWARKHAGVEASDQMIKVLIEESISRGLFGMLARLHCLGVLPLDLPPKTDHKSSAQIISDAFSDAPQVPVFGL